MISHGLMVVYRVLVQHYMSIVLDIFINLAGFMISLMTSISLSTISAKFFHGVR